MAEEDQSDFSTGDEQESDAPKTGAEPQGAFARLKQKLRALRG